MPGTFQALGVLVLALLPGAFYTWGYERQVGSWGIGRSDRLLRFTGGSVAFHVLAAPLTYFLYSKYWTSSIIRDGKPLPLWLWAVLAGYVLVPFLVGDLMGRDTHRGGRVNELLSGPNPAPRAWDHLFSSNPRGWVRVRLGSGLWVGGLFLNQAAPMPATPSGELRQRLKDTSKRLFELSTSTNERRRVRQARYDAASSAKLSKAYAAAYPETQDIYLPYTVTVDPNTGVLLLDANGKPQIQAMSILLKWENIEYFEVKPFNPWY